MIDRKLNTHTVIKNADIDKYLSKEDANNLKALIERLRVSKACNSLNHKENYYYIVNTDEPYAEEVLQVILNGEKEKTQSESEETCTYTRDDETNAWECSECGLTWVFMEDYTTPEENDMYYCPKCGRKIKAGE
nr:hypothetical protein [uncultured Anaerocolumna sp.]